MSTRTAVCLLACLLTGFVSDCTGYGAGSRAAAPPDPDRRLEMRPCWFDYEPGDPSLSVACAVLRVPEHWEGAPGAEVVIPVVVLRAGAPQRWATLVPGGGGPGGSVGLEPDSAATTIANLENLALASGGDVVVIDQRGAGIAQPAFRCAALRAATLRWLAASWSVEDEAALWSEAASRCRADLIARGIAPDAYDAVSVAGDIEALRRALGFERWNLFGTSYGGELALVYARLHPTSVRALVLDSPAVPGSDLVSPPWFQHVLEGLFARCADDEACRRDFPDLGAVLDRVLARLDERPVTVSVSDPDTLAPVPVLVTAPRFLDLLFVAMYDTDLAHQIPMLITATDRGSFDWLTQFAREYVWSQLDVRFADAMLGAVPCRESVPYDDLARVEREAKEHRWTRAFVGIEPVTTAVCRAWQIDASAEPRGTEPMTAPALLLTGRLDPVIPLPDVQRAAAQFVSSTLIDLPATGHSAEASWWSCLDPLIGAFLAHPQQSLDGEAIEACRQEADTTEFPTLHPAVPPLSTAPAPVPGP